MGHHEVVQLLLELPAGTINFEAIDKEHFTGFMGACSCGHVTVVNLLLQLPEGSINIQAKESNEYGGWNGFMHACLHGHLSVIRSFLELPQGRFNVNETNESGDTGLDIAVRREHQDIAEAIRQYKTRAQ